MSDTLFALEQYTKIDNANYKCKDCNHIQPEEHGSKIIFYCRAIRSGRTYNKLLKIRWGDFSCRYFILKDNGR